MKFTTRIAVLLSAFALPVLPAVAQAPVAAVAQAEDAKLTAFLDGEFAEWVKTQPQLATRLGIKAGGDQWNDTSDAAADARSRGGGGRRRGGCNGAGRLVLRRQQAGAARADASAHVD
jgi:hypothetical protein